MAHVLYSMTYYKFKHAPERTITDDSEESIKENKVYVNENHSEEKTVLSLSDINSYKERTSRILNKNIKSLCDMVGENPDDITYLTSYFII